MGFAILAAEDLIGGQVDVVCNTHVYGSVGDVQEIAVRHGKSTGFSSKCVLKIRWQKGDKCSAEELRGRRSGKYLR